MAAMASWCVWTLLASLASVEAAQLGQAKWWPFASEGADLPADVQALVSAPSDEAEAPASRPASKEHVAVASLVRKRAEEVAALQQQRIVTVTRSPVAQAVEEYDTAAAAEANEASGAKTVLAALLATNDAKVEVPETPVSPVSRSKPVLLTRNSGRASTRGGKSDALAQCLDFAQWAKHQGVEGKEVTKLFMSTCKISANAPKKYVEMCKGLESELKVLEKDEDWLPAKACDLLLKHFRQSQVGSNPLED